MLNCTDSACILRMTYAYEPFAWHAQGLDTPHYIPVGVGYVAPAQMGLPCRIRIAYECNSGGHRVDPMMAIRQQMVLNKLDPQPLSALLLPLLPALNAAPTHVAQFVLVSIFAIGGGVAALVCLAMGLARCKRRSYPQFILRRTHTPLARADQGAERMWAMAIEAAN